MADLGAEANWDRLLAGCPEPSLLQSYGWGEVQGGSGWRVHRLQVATGAGALPVTALVAPSGVPGLTRTYLPRGPACAASDAAGFLAVVAAAGDLGRRERSLALEVEPPWPAAGVPPGHPIRRWPGGLSRQPLATVVVDLRPGPEELLASFHSKTRYNLRLAERRGVLVRPGDVAELSSCLRATERRQGIGLPPQRHLELVLGQLGSRARVRVAEAGGQVVAAVLLAHFDGQLVYLYGGATGQHRELMPNHLLHWRAMIEAREEGLTTYDLWGIPEDDRPDHPWYGLARFKLGFGGTRVRYLGCRRLPLRPGGALALTAIDRARQAARRRRRG